jgi:hypothetical protein
MLSRKVNFKGVKAFEHIARFVFRTASAGYEVLSLTAGPDRASFTSEETTALGSAAVAMDIFRLQAIYPDRFENLGINIGPLLSRLLS